MFQLVEYLTAATKFALVHAERLRLDHEYISSNIYTIRRDPSS